MIQTKYPIAAILLSIFITANALAEKPRVPAATTTEKLQQWMEYLADDDRLGRATGTAEMQEVTAWLENEFKSLGLEPMPGIDGYQQHFEFSVKRSKDGPEEAMTGTNVIGIIEGADETLKHAYLIVSAHYDHVGVNEQAEGDDKIFNGADDDASGVVATLGLAYEIKRLIDNGEISQPPYSIAFIAWDAEELGLKGSAHFVNNPPVPLSQIKAMFNFELVGVTKDGKSRSVWMTGSQYSTLFDQVAPALEQSGWSVTPDPFPDFMLFFRSDNAPFALGGFSPEPGVIKQALEGKINYVAKGIPAHSFSVWNGQKHYHSPSDEIELIDFENLSALVKALAPVIGDFPDQQNWVRWKQVEGLSFEALTDE